ncbi:Acyltransferase LovD [Tolypocladium ophioglossoides CBS 100239]|uniref:Acyltransferase LovD n=1 Tax=Tolypocladium ophioglossoides (strain CBS 100239) TaxID=1163406 RepID=A0A0L0NG05_TOLOC|nr:Acyltransferase LovD [Tolypocladium ophioglossoides CBS 100239]
MDTLNAILQAHVAPGADTTDKLLGAAFVVANNHGIAYTGAAGRIGFDAASRPFAGDSFTWVASLTKLVTTTCLMQLVERGRVALDEDVRGHAPELARMQILRGFDGGDAPILEDNVKPITLRQVAPLERMLLTHTVGLGYDLADPDLVKWSAKVGRTANNLDWSRDGFTTPLKFAPGEGWYYGTALDWAGLVLESVTGQSIGRYMQEHVFDPLGMADTGFWPERLPQTASRTVACSRRDASSRALEPVPVPTPREHDVESGGAGLYTTAADYARFLHSFLHGTLVGAAALRDMFTPQLDAAQSAMFELVCYRSGVQDSFAPEFPAGLALNHGLGGAMNMEDVLGKRRKGSLMWSGMCNSRWWVDRETGIAAVLIVTVREHGDPVVARLYDELERAVYAHLVAAK